MASCEHCGDSLEPRHRYCPTCGRQTPSRGDVRVLAADSTDLATGATEHVVSRGAGAGRTWAIALCVLLASAAGFAVLRGDDRPDSTDPEDAASEVTLPPLDSSTTSPTTTVAPTTQAPTTRAPTTTQPAVTVVPELADASGLTLVAGDPLSFVDLETGAVTRTSIRSAFPVATVDGRLVYLRAATELLSVAVDDLSGSPTRFDIDGFVIAARAGFEPGTIAATVQAENGESISNYVLDVASGAVVFEEALSADTVFSLTGRIGSQYRTPRSGGVYRRSESGWIRELDGAVVASGAGFLLVDDCTTELECSMQWYTADLDPVDLLIPDDITDGEVLPGGRLLVYRSGFAAPQTLLDLDTGETIATGLSSFGLASAVRVDPTGRYASYLDDRQSEQVIVDLETGTKHRVDLGRSISQNFVAPLLIETP